MLLKGTQGALKLGITVLNVENSGIGRDGDSENEREKSSEKRNQRESRRRSADGERDD